MSSANYAWRTALNDIMTVGVLESPRDQKTLEILGNAVTFDMNYPVCYHQDRHLNYAFMAREAWTITGGTNAVSDISDYNPYISQFSDNGISFAGHYGPQFIYQRNYILETLWKDIASRRATLTIWKPNPGNSSDYPCTIAMTWMIRDGALQCFVKMRSSDAWLGLPYDMFVFTMMSVNILCELKDQYPKLKLGHQYMFLCSSHLYEQHQDSSVKVALNIPDKEPIEIYNSDSWEFYKDQLTQCFDKTENGTTLWTIRP